MSQPVIKLPPTILDEIHILVQHDSSGRREYQILAPAGGTPQGAPLASPIEEPFDPFYIMQELLEAGIHLNANTHQMVNQAVRLGSGATEGKSS